MVSAQKKSHQTIFRQIGISTGIVIVLTVADKILAVVKEMAIAHTFGLSPELDVFNIAYAFPGLVMLMFTDAFASAFIPLYVSSAESSTAKKTANFTLTLFYACSAFFAVLAGVLYFLTPYYFPLLGYGFDAQRQALGIELEQILMLLVLVDGVGIILSALLQAKKGFVNLCVAPMFVNLTLICFLMFSAKVDSATLVWGFVVGTVLKCAYMMGALRWTGVRFFVPFTFSKADLKPFVYLAVPLLGSGLIANSNMLIDQVMATDLSAGGVSALRYAYRINDLPVQILILALVKALLPYVSKQAHFDDFEGLRYVFKNCMIFVGLISIPTISYVSLFSKDIVQILFERGAFDASATELTASTLFYYGIGLFFYAYAFVNGTFFIAMKQAKVLFYMGFLTAALNVSLNFLFIHIFQTVQGIALSTTVTMGVVSTIFIFLLQNKLHMKSSRGYLVTNFMICVCSVLLYVGGLFVRDACVEWDISIYVYFPALSALFGLTYIVLLYLFKTKDLQDCLGTLVSRRT